MDKTRDLARTRERLLKAAMAEFAAKGLIGARCADIARRARVNKRMLFYCFGSKENLYREIVRRKFAERARFLESGPDDLAGAILHWYEAGSSDFDWVRLLEWEALETPGDQLVGDQERRDYFKRTLARLRRAQLKGRLPADVDLLQLVLSMVALTVFPLAFPQMTRLASGLAPTDPRFQRRRADFLRWLGDRLTADVRSTPPRIAASSRRRVTARSPRESRG